MIAYLTKHALSRGILIVNVVSQSSSNDVPSIEYYTKDLKMTNVARGTDWWENKQLAIIDAERKRERKIKSLQDSINKLKRIDFNKIVDERVNGVDAGQRKLYQILKEKFEND